MLNGQEHLRGWHTVADGAAPGMRHTRPAHAVRPDDDQTHSVQVELVAMARDAGLVSVGCAGQAATQAAQIACCNGHVLCQNCVSVQAWNDIHLWHAADFPAVRPSGP